MKEIILAITLLFSHMSFGLDALDGKSLICKRSEGEIIYDGFRFVGHRVIRDTFYRAKSTVYPS